MKIQATVTKIIDKKTCKCTSSSYKKHPVYGKYLLVHKKYLVDSTDKEVCEGSKVEITGSRPLSRRKRWEISNVVK